MASEFPRGIAPELLISQVKNTMPWLFEPGIEPSLDVFPPARRLREFEAGGLPSELSHFEYFRLCLFSHYLTVATPVPTDVDNQIRQKLWPAKLPLETALAMTDLVIESRGWDFAQVTDRVAYGAKGTPWEKEPISGHNGEWFTVAAGAYGALGQYREPEAAKKRQEVLQAIADETHRHSEIFGSLWRAEDGMGSLRASAAIAHNFGDLDRVMDMWKLPAMDPLRQKFYKLGIEPFDAGKSLRYLGRLWTAGELYKSKIDGSSMALENHRHYALRKPRCLRQSRSLLIPMGPFFDDWGGRVARLPEEQVEEASEALRSGWIRQPGSLGYGRALKSILELHPRLSAEGLTKAHLQLFKVPKERFEKRWAEEALRHLEEIPSRA